MAFITQADLEARLSRVTVRELLDGDNVGAADAVSVAQVLEDASAHVWAQVYGFNAAVPTSPASAAYELRRLALEYAVGRLALYHPEVLRLDGHALLDRVQKELVNTRAVEQVENPAHIVTSPKRGW